MKCYFRGSSRGSEHRALDSLGCFLKSGIGCQILKIESLAQLTQPSSPLLRAGPQRCKQLSSLLGSGFNTPAPSRAASSHSSLEGVSRPEDYNNYCNIALRQLSATLPHSTAQSAWLIRHEL